MLVNSAIHKCIEHELRIALVVAYLSLICQSFALLCEVQTYGVDTCAVVNQRVQIALTIDTRCRRCSYIEHQFLEVDVECLHQACHRVVALTLYVKFHFRQQALDGRLVDNALIKLRHNRIAQHAESVKQTLIVATCIEFHYEVATLYATYNSVRRCIDMQTYEVRTQCLFLSLDEYLVNQSSYLVGQLHV